MMLCILHTVFSVMITTLLCSYTYYFQFGDEELRQRLKKKKQKVHTPKVLQS